MNNKTTIRVLRSIGACKEAVQWATEHGGTSQEIWDDCRRGDWMGWYLGRSEKYNQSPEFYIALAEIIEKQAVPVYAKYDNKEQALINVVRTLRLYAKGKASREDLSNASSAAANAAATATTAYYAANAANAAAYAAAAATATTAYYAATVAASSAAYAAAYYTAAAYYAATNAHANDNIKKSLKESANIFRKYFPKM